MKQYGEASICRRRILISYFNEDFDQDCGNCDVCKNPKTLIDATILAQKALSAIARSNEKVAMGMLVDILRGSRNQSILKHGYDQLKTFGVGKDLKYEVWLDYLLQMLNYGVMDIAYDEGHTFKLNSTSVQILQGERKIQLAEYKSPAEKKAEEIIIKPKTKKEVIKSELFENLRNLRKQIAESLGTAPYIIFSDATLSDMAEKRPTDKQQFLGVSGVGQEKLNRFGDVFMTEIKDYISEKSKTTKVHSFLPSDLKTHEYSFQLFNEGKTIEEIAQLRNYTTGTIASHLVKMHEQGEDINLKSLIDNWTFEEIKKSLTKLQFKKGDMLKSVFEDLGEQIGYDKIRIALAILEI